MAAEPEIQEANPRTLQGRGTIEAYISKVGMIVLKQQNMMDDDSFLLLNPADVPVITQWLKELSEEHKEWVEQQARIAANS